MSNLSKGDFEPSVRYINGLTIYFKDKYTIIAFDKDSSVTCQRWYDRPLGSYAKQWRPFCDELKTRNYLKSTRDIWNIAFKYEIGAMGSYQRPTIPERIKVRATYYKANRRKK